jgi:hypothetical protein
MTLQTHDLKETFQCFWVGDHGLHCNELFYGYNLSAHLREVHHIHGADKAPVYCLWDGCSLGLKKESLSRHVEERHLCIAHPCNICGKSYSRRDTLSKHIKACSGS